jgi:hypothetical protein
MNDEVHSEGKSPEEVPAELKQFEGKTPAQMFRSLFPNVNIEGFTGILCGLVGMDTGIPIPTWAVKASKQFWKYYFGKEMDMMNSIEDQGAFARMMEEISKEICGEPPTEKNKQLEFVVRKFGNPFLNLIAKDAHSKSPEETAKFYKGRVRGDKVMERIRNPDYLKMQKRAPIYLCIAIRWQQFQLDVTSLFRAI